MGVTLSSATMLLCSLYIEVLPECTVPPQAPGGCVLCAPGRCARVCVLCFVMKCGATSFATPSDCERPFATVPSLPTNLLFLAFVVLSCCRCASLFVAAGTSGNHSVGAAVEVISQHCMRRRCCGHYCKLVVVIKLV